MKVVEVRVLSWAPVSKRPDLNRHPGAVRLLREWRVVLDRPLEALLLVLSDPSEWARELRHVSPFGGVLSARERTAVYRAFAREDAAT